MASSSGSSTDIQKLISKAVSGVVTKVLANLQPKNKRQEKPESDTSRGSDDDFAATPHAKRRKTKDNMARSLETDIALQSKPVIIYVCRTLNFLCHLQGTEAECSPKPHSLQAFLQSSKVKRRQGWQSYLHMIVTSFAYLTGRRNNKNPQKS